jgi:hypothetical protein
MQSRQDQNPPMPSIIMNRDFPQIHRGQQIGFGIQSVGLPESVGNPFEFHEAGDASRDDLCAVV